MVSATVWFPTVYGRRGLRQRVAIGIALLSFLVVSAHSIAIYVITEDQEEAEIDALVTGEMESLLERYSVEPSINPARSRYLAEYIVRNAPEREALPPHLRSLPIGIHETFEDGREWHVAVRAVNDVRFYVAYDAEPHEVRLRQFRWLLIFGVLGTAFAAAVLGYVLAGLLTQPVTELAARVSGLDPGSSAPIATRYRDEEVNQLAQAFDAYSARMAEFVAREQEFTANVSHELRTPLTAVRTGGELLLADVQLSADARERVARIQRAAEQMDGLVQSLLLLARAGKPRDTDTVALREAVAELLEPMHEAVAAHVMEFRNEIPSDLAVRVDPTALSVVLTNLLRNAIASTRAGSVTVRVREQSIEIEDTGHGIAMTDLPYVFERLYRGRDAEGRQGHGLGLAIVKRICEQQQWTLDLASEPGKGTRVTLHLPEDVWLNKNTTLS